MDVIHDLGFAQYLSQWYWGLDNWQHSYLNNTMFNNWLIQGRLSSDIVKEEKLNIHRLIKILIPLTARACEIGKPRWQALFASNYTEINLICYSCETPPIVDAPGYCQQDQSVEQSHMCDNRPSEALGHVVMNILSHIYVFYMWLCFPVPR